MEPTENRIDLSITFDVDESYKALMDKLSRASDCIDEALALLGSIESVTVSPMLATNGAE